MLPSVFISATSGVTPTICISNKFPVDAGASHLGTIHFLFFSCHFPFRSNNVEPRNQTDISDFFLLGLTDKPELQPLHFCLFLSMYLNTVLGNLLIILAVISDLHLHTCM